MPIPFLVWIALAWGGGMIMGGLLTANYKDRVYKELLKKHDEETARRLTLQFDAKLKELEDRYEKNEKVLKQRVRDLCASYGVPANCVLAA